MKRSKNNQICVRRIMIVLLVLSKKVMSQQGFPIVYQVLLSLLSLITQSITLLLHNFANLAENKCKQKKRWLEVYLFFIS